MRGPRRPCWIIRVHPPLEARRMVEPPVAARSKTPVRFEPSANGMLGSLGGLVRTLVANPLRRQPAHYSRVKSTPIGRVYRRDEDRPRHTARNLWRQIEIGSRFYEASLSNVSSGSYGQEVCAVFVLKMFAQRQRKDACHARRICLAFSKQSRCQNRIGA
jgi:hypothetical protein